MDAGAGERVSGENNRHCPKDGFTLNYAPVARGNIKMYLLTNRTMLTPVSSPGLGEPTLQPALQIVPTRPNISELIDYLDATVRARGRVTVPTQKVNFLVKLDPPNKPTWWKRLWGDPLKFFPKVHVTVELVQVGVSLIPLSNYENGVIFKHALEEYLLRLHSKNSPCDTGFVTALGGAFRITTKNSIEKELGIDGQLDTLLKESKITLPMSAQDSQRHFWIVYATFPTEIRKYLIPEDRVVLDEFEFDKSSLTKAHIGKIIAIARHSVAMTKSVGSPPKIVLAGHTDDRGTEKYNESLGGRRASEVNKALREAIDGISPGLSKQVAITPRSFGETRPLIKARTEAGHARNRRVEVFLPIPLPRCPRVSLRAVVKRALTLLPRLWMPEQAQRISCLLSKVIQKGADDRWIPSQGVLNVYDTASPLGAYPFTLLRDQLSSVDTFGPAVPDASVLRTLEWIDGQIIEGMGEVNKKIQVLSGAASQGVSLMKTMKAMDALRAWMHARVKDDSSIYSCYRKV
ncbi:MAG: OmpA family protein [Blastocatellia bacterium]